MISYISTTNHPESKLSGSTLDSLLNYYIENKVPYMSVTDNGYMSSVLDAIILSEKKKNIKIIPGCEFYFKDLNCPILKNSKTFNAKYFKIVIHAQDQEAYQKLVSLSSRFTTNIIVNENKYSVLNWNDLKELSKYNVNVTTSDIECITTKALLNNEINISEQYFKQLLDIFQNKFYPAITLGNYNAYWDVMVKITLSGGKIVNIPSKDRIETDKPGITKALHAYYHKQNHKKLKAVYINRIRYEVKKQHQDIVSVELIHDFKQIENGDLQKNANLFTIEMVNKYNLHNQLLVNGNVYYTNKDDKIVQDMKLGNEDKIYSHHHIRNDEELKEFLEDLKIKDWFNTIVQNTVIYGEKHKDFKLNYNYSLPNLYDNPREKLLNLIKNSKRFIKDPVYVNRIKEELDVLVYNGIQDLSGYFLPIVDIMEHYASLGYIVGPGRGSAAGSLIAYLIGITQVDPIKHGLSFSRFITLDRIQTGNWPDIDFDLPTREPLVGLDGNSGYLYNTYGNRAAHVSTRSLLRIKSAILDVNRFVNNGTVEPEIEKLSKSLPNTPQGVNDYDYVFGYTNEDGEEVEGILNKISDLHKYKNERPKEWDMVTKALSLSRQHSVHACAFMLAGEPIENRIPIFPVNEKQRVTQVTAKSCEWVKFLKYDFLVVSALKDINDTIRLINKKDNIELPAGYFMFEGNKTYIWDLPVRQEVFDDLSEGNTETVFQLNTVSVTPFVKQNKPNSIGDCAVITSLVRPGPLDFIDVNTGRNMAQEYTERRFGRSVGDIEILNELLPETYSVLVFQEQITKIAMEIGGMTPIEAENVRIAMGKKKIKLMESLKPIFIRGAEKKVDVKTANKIWDMMATFGRYGFAKNHAVAYSFTSYACAFLKYFFPLEWWASVLNNADNKEINEVLYKYVQDKLVAPDINKSENEMVISYEQKTILNKLSSLSGLGVKVSEAIVKNRPYSNLKDFVSKKVCSIPMTRKLIYVGIMDSLFEPNTHYLKKLQELEDVLIDFEYDKKIEKYNEKIDSATTDMLKKRAINNKEKFLTKPKPVGQIPGEWISITPLKGFIIKKTIFPTLNLDLQETILKNTKYPLLKNNKFYYITDNKYNDYPIFNKQILEKIDSNDVSQVVNFATPGYVLKTEIFSYQKGAKKALKMIVDHSGYITERVLWPDYNTGELKYDPNLQDHSVVWFFYQKKPGKPYTNILDIKIEEYL